MKNVIRVDAMLGLVAAATIAAPAFASQCTPAPGAGMGLVALGAVGAGVRVIKRKFGK